MGRYLDPADPKTTGTWTPPGWLPQAVRAFGRYPDVRAWLPGDLLLFSSVSPDRISKSIQDFQLQGHAPGDARWTHAAVYMGDEETICDSDFDWFGPRGVSVKPLHAYFGKHLILTRRAPSLTQRDQLMLVVNAVRHTGDGYDFAGLARLGWKIWRRKLTRLFSARRSARSVFCSRLFADAFLQTTKRVLQDPWLNDTTPAFLSATSDLVDVATTWLSIAAAPPALPPGP